MMCVKWRPSYETGIFCRQEIWENNEPLKSPMLPFQELTLSGWFWDVFLNDPYGCFQKAFSITDFMLIDSILFGGC